MGTTAVSRAPATPGGGGQAALKLEHACLQLFEPSKDGSLDKPGGKIGQIDFQFNPKELVVAKSASWARVTGKGSKKSGPPQYKGPQPSKLTLEMFFDSTEKSDSGVVERVEKLFSCCVPTPESRLQNKGSPPWVLFRWGGLTGFLSYIGSVQVKYTLFTASGLPVRAICTVTLEEIAGETPKQNPSSGGLTPRRAHVVVEGDTLAGIAYREYGDPTLWRAVAAANAIDDPMRLRPGTSLLLPATRELAASVPPGTTPARSMTGAAHAVR
jgi:hypothetical protein